MKLSERSKSKIAAKFDRAVKEIDTGKTVENKDITRTSDEPAGVQMMTVDPEQLRQLMSSPEAEQIINMIADGVCGDLEIELDSIIKFYKSFAHQCIIQNIISKPS